jgi:hypothetical protein
MPPVPNVNTMVLAARRHGGMAWDFLGIFQDYKDTW